MLVRAVHDATADTTDAVVFIAWHSTADGAVFHLSDRCDIGATIVGDDLWLGAPGRGLCEHCAWHLTEGRLWSSDPSSSLPGVDPLSGKRDFQL